jgi:hypothetical protein
MAKKTTAKKKTKSAKAKKKAGQPMIIVAVAIGNPGNNYDFQDPNDSKLANVRPYITGLKNWLADQKEPPATDNSLNKYILGEDYIIKYRECDKNDLLKTFDVNPDLIFCMSTTVLSAAQLFTRNAGTKTPIVGITSNPENQQLDENVCGVSARRPQHVHRAYEEFVKRVGKKKQMYALHKKKYAPSEAGKFFLPKSVITIDIDETDKSDDIVAKIHAQLPHQSGGLVVLPVDQFFGAADKIINEAQNTKFTPTWWLIRDLRTSGAKPYGGFGVDQETCGRYMAERVANIWSTKRIPDPPFVEIEDKYNKATVSKAVAKMLNLKEE